MRAFILGITMLASCTEQSRVDSLVYRITYIQAVSSFVKVVCPCGLGKLDLELATGWIDELTCNQCPSTRVMLP